MTKQITVVTQMTGGSEGISLLIDSWRNQISQDQQYREFTQNSIESIKRVQKQNPESVAQCVIINPRTILKKGRAGNSQGYH